MNYDRTTGKFDGGACVAWDCHFEQCNFDEDYAALKDPEDPDRLLAWSRLAAFMYHPFEDGVVPLDIAKMAPGLDWAEVRFGAGTPDRLPECLDLVLKVLDGHHPLIGELLRLVEIAAEKEQAKLLGFKHWVNEGHDGYGDLICRNHVDTWAELQASVAGARRHSGGGDNEFSGQTPYFAGYLYVFPQGLAASPCQRIDSFIDMDEWLDDNRPPMASTKHQLQLVSSAHLPQLTVEDLGVMPLLDLANPDRRHRLEGVAEVLAKFPKEGFVCFHPEGALLDGLRIHSWWKAGLTPV